EVPGEAMRSTRTDGRSHCELDDRRRSPAKVRFALSSIVYALFTNAAGGPTPDALTSLIRPFQNPYREVACNTHPTLATGVYASVEPHCSLQWPAPSKQCWSLALSLLGSRPSWVVLRQIPPNPADIRTTRSS